MKYYAIIYWTEDNVQEIWGKIYQTEQQALTVLDALQYWDWITDEGIVVPLELVTI